MKASLLRFFEAHPRFRATVIVALVVGIWALDMPRVAAARDHLGHPWSAGIGWGAALGVVLLAVAAGGWLARRRFPDARSAIDGVSAVVGLGLIVVTHPRRGDDSITSVPELALVIGSDVAFALVLLAVAWRTVRRPPVRG